jgi:hypothetical protein
VCSTVEVMYMEFWMENVKRRNHMEGIDMDGKITLKYIVYNGGKEMYIIFWMENLKRSDHL